MALHEKPMFDIKEKGKCKYCNKALTGQQNQNYFTVRVGSRNERVFVCASCFDALQDDHLRNIQP
jgi:hypothetical protein